jgi:hypothetical protein
MFLKLHDYLKGFLVSRIPRISSIPRISRIPRISSIPRIPRTPELEKAARGTRGACGHFLQN